MIKKQYIILSTVFFILGFLFFAYQKEWIIFRLPKVFHYIANDSKQKKVSKKSVVLNYWNNSKWNSEKIDIIWTDNESENLQRLICSWLILMDEEKLVEKVSLQTALLSLNGQDLFLSFDRNILDEEKSTYEKLMIIESLLKTLRESGIKTKRVRFLVHHQEMNDSHLDFSHFWQIEGFINLKI